MNGRTPTTTQPIKIVQLNIQRKKHLTIQLLNNHISDIDILLLQEPAWSFIGREQNSGRVIDGPVALQGWSTILPVASQHENSPRPHTLTYFRPRSDFSITLPVRTDIMEDRDIQILEIAQTNQPTSTIINIYNDSPKGELCILNQLRNNPIALPNHPTLITGDFNLHHPTWSRDDRALDQDQLSTTIAEWLAQENYTLLNKRGEITHLARHAGERASVIDLSFANSEAARLDTFKHWTINPDLSLDSDHNAITFSLDHGLKEIPNLMPIKYNTKKVDPDEWTKSFDQELKRAETVLAPLLNNKTPSSDQLDVYAETVSEAIQNALAATAPERRPSPNAKPWWDEDLSTATRNIANARTALQTHQNLTGEFDLTLHTNLIRNRNFFKRL
jgi:hypothetical protein